MIFKYNLNKIIIIYSVVSVSNFLAARNVKIRRQANAHADI